MNSLVVTTSIRGSSKTQVWDGTRPLALGHPMRFVLERSETGVRIRDLTSPLNKIESGRAHEIPNEKLQAGAELEVNGFNFRIRSALSASPVFESAAKGASLRVYHCAGKWILDSHTIDKTYTAREPALAPP